MSLVAAVNRVSAPSTPAGGVATAAGYLALLNENDLKLREIALQKLLSVVDVLWHEIAEALPDIEGLADDPTLPLTIQRTAAAVASRVFFHLNEPQQALKLALMAGEEHFQVESTTMTSDGIQAPSPYVERLIAAALDAYVGARQMEINEEESVPAGKSTGGFSSISAKLGVDADVLTVEALQPLVYRLLTNSCNNGKYDHALGIALEARETEKVRSILVASGPSISLLKYTLSTVTNCMTSKNFRGEAYQVIAECWETIFNNTSAAATTSTSNNKLVAAYDLITVYQLLNQPIKVADILKTLLNGAAEEEILTGYQLCFDLMDTDDQAFILKVATQLQDVSAGTTTSKAVDQALRVLSGGFSAELALSFLYKQSNADRFIMEQLKKALEERSSGSRSSVLHNSSVLTHSYLYAGTTNDSFLRDHIDWMKKASNWAKFSATASLGVVHASHITEAMQLLQPYLPPTPPEDGGPTTISAAGGYAEGGSLYALGLIHGSHSGTSTEKRLEANTFLRSHLRASHANEVISHGACLGVGLTAMGSADVMIINELKEVLDTDSALAGEAAGIAIGLIFVGTGAGNIRNTLPPSVNNEEIMEIVAELKNYARETQHEKIIRGIAMGLACMNYGQEENADAVIEEMSSDRDPIMRYGAQYAIALAYCGTGSNKATCILLHTAVSDVSNDVRMAAVIGLAFVLYKTPDRVPQLVKLLLESFNPHVRYASCMAVGIAMAGTGDSESIALLEPMLEDTTDYVRQGAFMGTAMIYMQQSDSCNRRKIRSFREKLMTTISEKHQSTLTKMGAILSIGIIDAGGRNCSVSLGSRNGLFTKRGSAVGLALWLQHWHWYPMMHMFSLALTPSVSIGLNKDFKYPKNFQIVCNSKASLYSYPKKVEEKKEEKKKRVETVTLSITAKEKARLARKKAKEGPIETIPEEDEAVAMDTDKQEEVNDGPKTEESADETKEAMDVDDEAEPVVKKKREPEPTTFMIGNPARITKAQSQYCQFDCNQRYRPIRPDEKPQGVVILTDTAPPSADDDDDEDNLGALRAPSLEPEGELPPPEPFEWTPPPPVAPDTKPTSEAEEEEESSDDKVSSAESSD